MTEDQTDWKNYDPSQDEVVAEIYGNKSRKNVPEPFAVPKVAGTDENQSGIANLDITVPRPMASFFYQIEVLRVISFK